MATVAELLVRISGNNSSLVKELNASKRQLSRFKSEMPNLIPDGSGKALLALAVGAGALGVQAVKLASSMEVNRLAFETMLGSGEKAKGMLTELSAFAEKTPFEFDSLVNSAKRMLGLGIAADQVLPQLKVVGDAVAAVGGNSESVDSITNAFAKMQASGFISAEQMNRLTDAGIPGWQLLSKVLSEAAGNTVTVGEAMKMAEAKSINATTAITGMMSEMSTRYGGAMDKMSGTNTGIWSNIHDTAIGVLRDIGDQLNTSLDVKQYLNKILGELTTFKASVQSLGLKQALIDIVPAGATATSLGIMAGAITSAAIPALAGMAISVKALGLAAGPVGLAITAIGALTALVSYNGIEYEKSGGAARAYNNAVYDGIGRMSLAGDEAGTFAGKLGGVYSAAIEAARAMVIFNKATGDVAGGQKSHIPYESTEVPAPPPPWVPPAAASGGADKIIAEAKRVSEAIEKEWVQTTKTQLQQLEIWQKEQLADLAKTQAENENYERDKERVAATYKTRRMKILQEEAAESMALWQSMKEGYEGLQSGLKAFGLSGGAKLGNDIDAEQKSRMDNIAKYYEDIQKRFIVADNATKAEMMVNLEELGIQHRLTTQGNLDFTAQKQAEMYEVLVQSQQKRTELEQNSAKLRADIDAAMQANSMVRLQSTLTAENAMRLANYEAQQSMMNTYLEASKAAAMTWQTSLMTITAQGFAPMKSAISDMITGAKTIGEGFAAMGKAVLKSIADIVAGWIAGQITMMALNALSSALGIKSEGTILAKSVASGAATAAAWAPAAAMVSLATFGANMGPAMVALGLTTGLAMGLSGIGAAADGGYQSGPGTGTSDNILSWLSNGEYVIKASSVKKFGVGMFERLNAGQMPAFAAGGIVTGPSLSTISASRLDVPTIGRQVDYVGKKIGSSSTPTQQPEAHYHISIQAWDGKSVDRWLNDSGATKIIKALRVAHASFEGI